jgi:hypothetical protein
VTEWFVGIAFVGFFLFGIGYLFWTVNDLIDAVIDRKFRQKFRVDLCGALKHSQPPWEQLVSIAESRGLSHKSTYIVVRNLLRDVLTGSETELSPYRGLLEQYIESYKAAEPFTGLPSETRVHLERVRERLGSDSAILDPLTERIRDLVSVYERDKSRQRLYAVLGVILGIIGLLFAAYAYFFPYSA